MHYEKFASMFFPYAEIMEAQNKPYLFTPHRIVADTVPEELYKYEIADAGDGMPWRIQKTVTVNYFGTIIGKEPLEMTDDRAYRLSPEACDEQVSSDGYFVGKSVRDLGEYLMNYEQLLK